MWIIQVCLRMGQTKIIKSLETFGQSHFDHVSDIPYQHQVTRSRHAENVQRRERYAMGGAKTVVCRQHLKNGVYCLESAVKNVVTIYIRQFWYVLVCSCK